MGWRQPPLTAGASRTPYCTSVVSGVHSAFKCDLAQGYVDLACEPVPVNTLPTNYFEANEAQCVQRLVHSENTSRMLSVRRICMPFASSMSCLSSPTFAFTSLFPFQTRPAIQLTNSRDKTKICAVADFSAHAAGVARTLRVASTRGMHLNDLNDTPHRVAIQHAASTPTSSVMASATDETPKQPWIMNAFAMTAPGHLAPGLWRHPDQDKQDLGHWVRLAKMLDEAKFHGLFFADVLGIYDVYQGPGNNSPALQSAAQIPILDVSLMVSAMAYATKGLSFGITASTTYEHPYQVARRYSTLDQITDGRVGWNVVTSYLQSAAESYGFEEQIEHDERYRKADEFMDVAYKLWEQSWEDDALAADKSSGVYADAAKVHKINHNG